VAKPLLIPQTPTLRNPAGPQAVPARWRGKKRKLGYQKVAKPLLIPKPLL
jgi:hypothetical protein